LPTVNYEQLWSAPQPTKLRTVTQAPGRVYGKLT
jgi:hypothetical protein